MTSSARVLVEVTINGRRTQVEVAADLPLGSLGTVEVARLAGEAVALSINQQLGHVEPDLHVDRRSS